MCGFVGIWGPGLRTEALDDLARRMTRAIAHRGPDDEGVVTLAERGIALGHRRLSILDTSSRGHQPMRSASGRLHLVYNGEVYNYRELRRDLERDGATFESDSDTEVLLSAIERWGVRRAVARAVGMFAFAVYDSETRRLVLARDRLGKKPLYYGRVAGVGGGAALVFASELHAFRRTLGDKLEIDRGALALLTRFGYVPEPYSAFEGVRKLSPGALLTIDCSLSDVPAALPAAERYYELERVIEAARRSPLENVDDARRELRAVLEDAVRLRLRSDVPLGAFLSGGIDSSLVVSLMQKCSERPVKTFSIGFAMSEYDESENAARIAEHLGTEHHTFRVTEDDVLGVVESMPRVYDEPFADSSQLPTYLVSKLAREHVKVALTGDGGDELFAGYDRHVWGRRVWRGLSRVPLSARRRLSGPIESVSQETWTSLGASLSPYLPKQLRVRRAGEKLHKLARIVGAQSPDEMQWILASYWDTPVVLGATAPSVAVQTDAGKLPRDLDFTERALWFDTVLGLPGDMLVKVDRATMAVGLEARQPLLDHRVLELAWRLPMDLKIRQGVGKWLLREVLSELLPRPLFEKPKSGFSVPVGEWLRGRLKPWAESLLSESSLRRHGVFDAAAVRAVWAAHLRGETNAHGKLWAVLMTSAWLDA